ncbi:uncharacterized protein LAESUDRAFT_70669 [Laetiporus sulphureus 93-53]|uniref:Uncharacterized protein n=1 Tax=Laetiporus sulphureus 93-53 TaxID=1314785 RepID=A0A165AWU4_9APHY|nr:uncharacterized protein LAESUDRAFT_70669 [Laetiporus sulphureus 93-53]KZS99805.1 hypothetical protein LAESUDRAFT_70669 [Laetiporus sulphureus 93-53]
MDHEHDHEMQDENEQPLYEEVYEEGHSTYQGQYDEEEEHDSRNEGDSRPETAPLTPPHVSRPLGRFMTPQLTIADRHVRLPNLRYSVGPGTQGSDTSMYGTSSTFDVSGPRRVRLVEPWKIEDIVVPLNDTEAAEDEEHKHVEETKTTEEEESKAPEPSPKKRGKVSVEERRAIRERRRSALRTPDTFFNGQVPGSRRTTLLPPSTPMLPALFANTGILSARSNEPSGSSENPLGPPPAEEKEVAVSVKEEENAEDSQVLLARMRHMVEGVRRRQSVETGELSRRMSVSPRKRRGFSLLQEGGYEGEDDVEGQEADADGEDEEAEVGVEDIQEDVEMVEEMDEHLEAGAEDEVDIEAERDAEFDEAAVNGPFETVEESADATPSRPLEVPQTPQLNDLRHLFSSRAAPSTPRFSGMREICFSARDLSPAWRSLPWKVSANC